MKQLISEKELEEIAEFEGESRGLGLASYVKFVLKKEGEQGLEKLNQALKEVGFQKKVKKIRGTDFYPVGTWIIFLLLIQRLFNYDDETIQEMGAFQAKTSLLFKLFTKHLVSIERAADALPRIWRQHFTVGDFKKVKLDKEERCIILRLEGFPFYTKLQCHSIIGMLIGSTQIILKGKVACEETKCTLRGDDYHEFILKW